MTGIAMSNTCNVQQTDSNLKNELLSVNAGVIQGLSVLWHFHVKLGHTTLQVLIQLGNLHKELLLKGLEHFTTTLY